MRLIDADALIRKFKTASPMAIDGRARQIVDDMPTVYLDCNISSDGTLTVTVPKGTHVGRVLVQEDGTQYGGLFYPDEDRKTVKWIDETFEPWGLVHHPYKCDQCYEHSETDSNYCPNCGAQMVGSDG